MFESFCDKLEVTAGNTCAVSGCGKQSTSKCDEKATMSMPRRTSHRKGDGTETLIRHITFVRLTDASHKVSTYHNKLGVCISNLISLTGNRPAKT